MKASSVLLMGTQPWHQPHLFSLTLFSLWKERPLRACAACLAAVPLIVETAGSGTPLSALHRPLSPSLLPSCRPFLVYLIWLGSNCVLQKHLLHNKFTGCRTSESAKQEAGLPQTPLPLSRVRERPFWKLPSVFYLQTCANKNSLDFIYVFMQLHSYNAYCFATYYVFELHLRAFQTARCVNSFLCLTVPCPPCCLPLRVGTSMALGLLAGTPSAAWT